MLIIPELRTLSEMSTHHQDTSKLPSRLADRNNTMLARECKLASVLLAVSGAVALLLAFALWV